MTSPATAPAFREVLPSSVVEVVVAGVVPVVVSDAVGVGVVAVVVSVAVYNQPPKASSAGQVVYSTAPLTSAAMYW